MISLFLIAAPPCPIALAELSNVRKFFSQAKTTEEILDRADFILDEAIRYGQENYVLSEVHERLMEIWIRDLINKKQ